MITPNKAVKCLKSIQRSLEVLKETQNTLLKSNPSKILAEHLPEDFSSKVSGRIFYELYQAKDAYVEQSKQFAKVLIEEARGVYKDERVAMELSLNTKRGKQVFATLRGFYRGAQLSTRHSNSLDLMLESPVFTVGDKVIFPDNLETWRANATDPTLSAVELAAMGVIRNITLFDSSEGALTAAIPYFIDEYHRTASGRDFMFDFIDR